MFHKVWSRERERRFLEGSVVDCVCVESIFTNKPTSTFCRLYFYQSLTLIRNQVAAPSSLLRPPVAWRARQYISIKICTERRTPSTRTFHTSGPSCQSIQHLYSKYLLRKLLVTFNHVFDGLQYLGHSELIPKINHRV